MNSLISVIQFCGNAAKLVGWFCVFGSHTLRVNHSSRNPHPRLCSGARLLRRQQSLARSTAWFAPTLLCLFLASVGASEPEPDQHRNAFRIAIDDMPVRLEGISTELDWGLNETCQLKLQLLNQSEELWKTVVADGGCTCLKIAMDEIPKTGVKPGEFLVANVVYTKPKEPGISPRSINFSINDTPAVLPVLVEWYAPVALQKLEQVKPDTWRVSGSAAASWVVKTLESLNNDVKVASLSIQDQTFVVELVSNVKVARSCWIRCSAESSSGGKSIEQLLTVSLESSEPRSIPTRLICHVNDKGMLSGDVRLFFPRARIEARPNLRSAVLVVSDGTTVPLSVRQKNLGRTAFKVDFASETSVMPCLLGDTSRIRFKLDDDSQLECPFLISME